MSETSVNHPASPKSKQNDLLGQASSAISALANYTAKRAKNDIIEGYVRITLLLSGVILISTSSFAIYKNFIG